MIFWLNWQHWADYLFTVTTLGAQCRLALKVVTTHYVDVLSMMVKEKSTMSRNHNSEGASNENQWLKWVFSLLLLAIGVGCAALATRWIGIIMGYPVPSTPQFITVYWIACIIFVLYAITWIFQGASYVRNLIGGVLLLAIGVGFATLAMGWIDAIMGYPVPNNVEFIIVCWTAFFFFLTYGATRIFLGGPLSGTIHESIVVIILSISVILTFISLTFQKDPYQILRILIFVLCPLLALLPFLLYFSFLSIKRNPLCDELKSNLRRIYRKDDQSRGEIISLYEKKFEKIFGSERDNGTKKENGAKNSLPTLQTLLPTILTTMLMSLGWLYTASKIFCLIVPPSCPSPACSITLDPVNYGFIGVYLFSLNFLFRRYVQSDLGPVAYSNVNLRLITTFIWSMLLWNIFSPEDKDFTNVNILAFAVGVFPDVGLQWLIKKLQAITTSGVPDQSKNYPLSQISGITIWIESRLLEEDIENVQNLATANLPELLLQTNYPLGRLIDWIDQAILQTHLIAYKKRPEDSATSVADDLKLNGITTASGFLAYFDNPSLRKDGEPGQLARLASEIRTETNLYHINAWHATYPERPSDTLVPTQPFNNAAIRILRALPNPPGPTDQGEWVELKNVSTFTFDLAEWRLKDDKGRVQPLTGSLAPEETLRIELTRANEQAMMLSNKGGWILLFQGDNRRAAVRYTNANEGEIFTFA